jgi:hypothetical protein
MTHVSLPPSIAASTPSPASHLDNATVELLLMRSKRSWTTASTSWLRPLALEVVRSSTSAARAFSA